MQKYRDIRLVAPNDPGSLRWVREARRRKTSRRGRQCDEIARDFDRQLVRMEPAFRGMVTSFLNKVDERILGYQEKLAGNRWVPMFREIDIVAGNPDIPQIFVELKVRGRTDKGIGGTSQVRKSLRIARHRWPNVKGIAFNVFMGGVFRSSNVPTVRFHSLSSLEKIVQNPPDPPMGFWLDGEEVVGEAIRLGLLPPDYPSVLREARNLALNPAKLLEPSDPGFGSLANAFSRETD